MTSDQHPPRRRAALAVDAGAAVYGRGDTSFRAAGGEAGIRRLVDDFYARMDEDPHAAVIRAMHEPDLTVSRDKLTLFLCSWLGGPRLYRARYGEISIPGVHAHLDIGETERDAWLACMRDAVEVQPWSEDFKRYLLRQIAIPAERVRQASASRRATGEG